MSSAAPGALFDRRLVWALSAVPLLPLLFYTWVHQAPLAHPEVVHLTGAFDLVLGAEAPPLTLADHRRAPPTRSVQLPGSLSRQGADVADLWLLKAFEVSEALAAEDALMFLPNLRTGLTTVFINGQAIGRQGIAETSWQQGQSSSQHFIGRGLLVPGENLLALKVRYDHSGLDGYVDDRMLIGPVSVVQPFVDKDATTRALLGHGGTLSMLVMVGLLIFLFQIDPSRQRRDVYGSCAFLLVALCVYLSAKMGIPWAWFARDLGTKVVLPVSIIAIVLGTGEFVCAFTLDGTATRLRGLNRAVCALFIALLPVLGGITAYRAFGGYVLVVEGLVLVLTARDVWRGTHEMAPLVFSAIAILVVTGINDLLTDLGVITTPRLFTYGGVNLALCATAVSFNEFMRISRDNADLTDALSARNTELADALVQANESARLKSEFLANTSHELRTPLNTIINVPQGLIDLYAPVDGARCAACGGVFELEAGDALSTSTPCPSCGAPGRLAPTTVYPDALPADEAVRYLSSVVGSGRHLLNVVNDLLDLSKLEAGQMHLSLEAVEVGALLGELEQTMTLLAERRGVTLDVAAPAAPLVLQADRVKLMQVLVNLVSNAVKFSLDGGAVHVRASRCADDGAPRVRIEVEDHGIGIADADQQVIFEGFRQVDTGHTRRFGGTGLGLTISRQLVHLHGGAIEVSSQLGEGSTFAIALPLTARAPDDPSPSAA